MADFKEEFSASLENGRTILRRFRKLAKPLGYTTALYGSVVLDGFGHDIDVQIMGTIDQGVSPNELAMRISKKHAKSIMLWKQLEHGDMQDVWVVFITHDNFYIDLHIKGAA